MAQTTYDLSAAQSGINYTVDINEIVDALQTLNSGATAPTDTAAYMLWADTTDSYLKIRSGGNSAWVTLMPLGTQLSTWIATLYGASGIGTTAPLKAGDDLNGVDATGIYRITSSTLNNTHGNGFVLSVERGSGNCDQLVFGTGDGLVIARTTANSGTTWSEKFNSAAASLGVDTIQGSAPVWLSNTTITMPALKCMDSLRTSLISCATATLNLGAVGLNGLDSGLIAANTWYYTYAILNPTTGATGFLASASASSPTLPSGYSVYRLLPYHIKTLSTAATIQPFAMHHEVGRVSCLWLTDYPDLQLHTTPSTTPIAIALGTTVPPTAHNLNCKVLYESRSTTSVSAVSGQWTLYWSPTNTASDSHSVGYNSNYTVSYVSKNHCLPISNSRQTYIWYTGTPNGGVWTGYGRGFEFYYLGGA